MRKLITLLVCVLFAASMMVTVGCGKKEEPAKPAAKPAVQAEPAKVAEPEKKAEEVKPAEAAKPAAPAPAPVKK